MMKAVPVPDLCAIFTLVLTLHARREYLPASRFRPGEIEGDRFIRSLYACCVVKKCNNNGRMRYRASGSIKTYIAGGTILEREIRDHPVSRNARTNEYIGMIFNFAL